MNRSKTWLLLIAAAVVALAATPAMADQGTVVKWSQPPVSTIMVPPFPTPPMIVWEGEDYPSDTDWRIVPMSGTDPLIEPNWAVADDFQSDGRPILTVRWWGSYFPDTGVLGIINGPGVFDDAYVISFFSDLAVNDPTNTSGFSQPLDLLGTYLADFSTIKIDPTPFNDWAGDRVFQYEVNLQDTHLFHPSPLATPISFDEVAGDIYWLSIQAMAGIDIDPASWEIIHEDEVNDPIPLEHYWGWLTRPPFFNDLPTETKLLMLPNPDGTGLDWVYPAWDPINPTHVDPAEMTFELLTVPEPSTLALIVLGLATLFGFRRRRTTRS